MLQSQAFNIYDPFWLRLLASGLLELKMKSSIQEKCFLPCLFLLLMPFGITYQAWKEATHLLITLLIRP